MFANFFAKYWGLCKKKIPRGWGNTQLARSSHQRRVPPLGEADDKCIIISLPELSSLTHFDAISRSHADTSISYALTLFSKVTLPFKLSEVLMNSEFAPSLALNFGLCSICLCVTNFLVSSGLSPGNILMIGPYVSSG